MSRTLAAALLVLGFLARTTTAQEPSPPSADDPTLAALNALLDEARVAQESEDHAGARARIAEAIEQALAELGEREDADALALLEQMARFAYDAGELRAAEKAREQVLAVSSRTLPGDHVYVQWARGNLAVTLYSQGDLAGARALQEQVLEVFSRTLPVDHHDLQLARQNLAATIKELGDLAGARALEEQVLAVFSRTLPEDHHDLQRARQGLAATIGQLGDLAGARALEEQVLAVRSRTLPGDHPELQAARGNLAGTLYAQGDLARARALLEQVVEVFSRTLPEDHPDLQVARSNVAITLHSLGDLARARALHEQVLEIRSRALPEDHPHLQAARANLAVTIKELGDLAGARALEEQVLEAWSRTLPEEHHDLQSARLNLAVTRKELGDFAGARALEEQVLEVRSRTLPADHPDLQAARWNLAITLHLQGDLAGARTFKEQVLEAFSRTLPEDHPDLQAARGNLAWTVAGELARAARTPGEKGEKEERDGLEQCAQLLQSVCRAQTNAARAALVESSAREAEARCEKLSEKLAMSLSFAEGLGVLEPIPALERDSFVLSETTRGAALACAALARRAAGAPRWSELREELRARNDELAGLVQAGATTESFQQALARKEGVERELLALARELSGGTAVGLDFDPDALARGLGERDAVVAYRSYLRWSLASSEGPLEETSVESLCAFVVRSPEARSGTSAELFVVELGPIEPIEAAVRAWRQAIVAGVERGFAADTERKDAARSRGEELRKLVFDPLDGALENCERVVVVLDDVLHLVPLDALPAGDGKDERDAVLGERWRIEARCTLTELGAPADMDSTSDVLVSLGGAAFNSEPLDPSEEEVEVAPPPETVHAAATRPRSAWERGFAPLTYTGLEAREVAALHDEVFGEGATSVVLEKRKASREALEQLAPRARWLHVATHGWFASESIRSWKDPEPIDALTGLGMRMSGEEQVRGMSPMLLCGLALAGANLPENELGRVPGLVTAEEIAALDLSRCELAVLSACDTNVGERRAGQGVASLQKALQMAGARSVITSLWKVPDEATRELMTDFYRRIWVEKKPKHQALWEAKQKLCNAVDDAGQPKYSTRDWAAWVLTGEQE